MTRILIVCSDAELASLLGQQFATPLVYPVHAPDVREAVRLVTSFEFDAIIIDRSTSEFGPETLTRLRSGQPDIPIIVVHGPNRN